MAVTVDHVNVKAQVQTNTGSSTYNEFKSIGSSKSPRTHHVVSDGAIISDQETDSNRHNRDRDQNSRIRVNRRSDVSHTTSSRQFRPGQPGDIADE